MKHKVMGWQPDQTNNRIAVIFGAAGGLWQFINNIELPVGLASKLLEAIITGLLAGFAGMVGKELFVIVRRYVILPMITYFKNRKK